MMRLFVWLLLSACTPRSVLSVTRSETSNGSGSPSTDAASSSENAGAQVDAGSHADVGSQVDAGAEVDAGETPPIPTRPPLTPSCDALPVAWTDITPENIDGGTGKGKDTGAAAVDPFQAGTLYVAGPGAQVFRSEDCGSTWRQVATGKNSAAFLATHDPVPFQGSHNFVSLVADYEQPGVLYGAPYYSPNSVWKTMDRGETWDPLIDPTSELGQAVKDNWYQSVSIDPTDHLHLVVVTHNSCFGGDAGCLGETFDGGQTWKAIPNPNGLGWQENGGALTFGKDAIVFGVPFGDFLASSDGGVTWPPHDAALGTSAGSSTLNQPANDGYFYLPTLHSMIWRSPDGRAWEAIKGPGRIVGLAAAGDELIASDQWTPSFFRASLSEPEKWEAMDAPSELSSGQGCSFLIYDEGNRVLYASCWNAGIFRLPL
jgi:photosystem II stability/assembly factor-like uncharacterized protein